MEENQRTTIHSLSLGGENMNFLNDFILPVILGICLCTGYIMKQWISDINNKFIPGLVAGIGVILSVWINEWHISPDIILSGMISGLASVGMHQMFKQFLENWKGDDT